MSENNAIYSNVTFDVTLEALLESPCLLLPCEAGYQPPTPEQVAFVQHYIGLPSEALAHFLGEDVTSSQISASGWRRMLDAANLINVQQDVILAKRFRSD
ncbi:hypothetical protein J7I01_002744 [Vibrio parahaemolyticus]|nr:hypothetical protein [Vibrio parahaemolyticus]